jgi:uncharacterized protein (TIGR00730 family)
VSLSVAVYCSSSDAVDPAYLEQADAFGAALGSRGHTLVYGGASVGSMGRVARAAKAAGGRVVGVIPAAMVDVEIANPDCDELEITIDLRERKAMMDDRADAFVALPGGFGTLEELFEILTAKQLGWHRRPVVLLDLDDFWRPLLDLCRHLYDRRFARPSFGRQFLLTGDIDAALDRCEAGDDPPAETKWI